MVLYALSHENDLLYRPLRQGMGLPEDPSSSLKATGHDACYSLREIFKATFYVLKSGCPWRLLPGDFPPWQTVFYHFRRFRLSGLWHRVFMNTPGSLPPKTLSFPGRTICGRCLAGGAAN